MVAFEARGMDSTVWNTKESVFEETTTKIFLARRDRERK